MISTNNVSYSYPGSKPLNFGDINLSSGEDLLIIGESGVGKTTLMHLLAGLRTPETGSITIGETEIQSLSQAKRDRFRGNRIGIIYQKPYHLKSITVLENLLMIQRMGSGKSNKKAALELLDQLNLSEFANRKPSNLSQGQQQRLSIAMAVVNDPEIILADEPTSSLDDRNCEAVISLLRKITDEHRNLIVITHDQRLHTYFNSKMTL